MLALCFAKLHGLNNYVEWFQPVCGYINLIRRGAFDYLIIKLIETGYNVGCNRGGFAWWVEWRDSWEASIPGWAPEHVLTSTDRVYFVGEADRSLRQICNFFKLFIHVMNPRVVGGDGSRVSQRGKRWELRPILSVFCETINIYFCISMGPKE